MQIKSGRPVTIGTRKRNLTIDDATYEAAKALGGGNFSAGVRLAVEKVTGLFFENPMSLASGAQLDRFGEMYGIPREAVEPDQDYRTRLGNYLHGVGIATPNV